MVLWNCPGLGGTSSTPGMLATPPPQLLHVSTPPRRYPKCIWGEAGAIPGMNHWLKNHPWVACGDPRPHGIWLESPAGQEPSALALGNQRVGARWLTLHGICWAAEAKMVASLRVGHLSWGPGQLGCLHSLSTWPAGAFSQQHSHTKAELILVAAFKGGKCQSSGRLALGCHSGAPAWFC